jgi:hypothetical protein
MGLGSRIVHCYEGLYLGTTVINQNYIQENINLQSRFREFLLQVRIVSLLASYKIRRNEIYRIIILLSILCGCETWFLNLGGESILMLPKNEVVESSDVTEVTARKWARIAWSRGNPLDLFREVLGLNLARIIGYPE